jgi:hypothetical protein
MEGLKLVLEFPMERGIGQLFGCWEMIVRKMFGHNAVK